MTDHAVLLGDIATRDVACLPVVATLGEAANLMAKRRFSSIVVIDDSRHPVGIITERNILKVMHDRVPLDSSLRVGMSAPVITMHADKDCLEAYQECLHAGIRHLVLVDGQGVVTGVVSETDFRSHLGLTALAGRRKISSLAKHSAIALPPNCALTQAIELMQAQRKSCVIVVENEKPVGIITERDMVRFYSGERSYTDLALGQVMATPVLTISRSATTNQAAEKMLAHKVRHLVAVDDEGRMVGLVSEHDLTQVVVGGLAEERAGIEENFLRILLDTLPDLVWLKDERGVYLACNHRFEMFFGARESEIVGKTDYDFVDKELADFFRDHDCKAMAAGKSSSNEEWLTFAEDGYRGLFETVKTPMHDNHGKLIGVLGVARDITEREHTKRALAESEQDFRTLAENLPDNIMRYNTECQVRYANPAVARSMAPETQPIVGMTPVESHPGIEVVADYQKRLEQVLATGASNEFEIAIPHSGGTMHFHHVVCVAEKDSGGKITGALGIGRDITERKRTEEALHFMAQRGGSDNAESILSDLVRHFGEVLGVDYVLIDRLAEEEGFAETVALYAKGQIIPNMRYELRGTPCDNVIGKQQCCYRQGVQAIFPEDRLLGELQVESYAGLPLWDSQGQPIGLIAVMDGKPFSNEAEITGLLKLMSVRVAAELERARSDRLLHLREREFQTLTENLPDNIIRYDRDCRVQYMNPSLARTVSSEMLPVVGKLPVEAVPDSLLIRDLQRMVGQVMASGERAETEFEIKHPDGSLHWHHVIFVPELNKEGAVVGALGIGRDINERKRGEENLRITASVFDTTQEAIVITDANNRIIDVNPAFTRITGYEHEEVMGRDPKILSSGRQDKTFYEEMWKSLGEAGSWRGELWNRRKEGELFAELLSISVIRDGSGLVQRYVGVFSDITYFKEYEAELSHVANYDVLTGIPNRRLLADRLGQAVAIAQRGGRTLAICYVDLDGFKEVNDMYGHEKGDQLLIEVTRRIQNELRVGDTVARLGGDEFSVLFNDLAHEQECSQILERLMLTIAAPVQLGEHSVVVSASVGVAFYPVDGEDGDTLLKNADQAMYIAKQNGKNRFHYYNNNKHK
ncbi:MAG: PAS domain S-box protein [Sideroxydans sp.]|nr:PAS domain S-box protein [Sideroxydans sp.]